MTHYVASTLEIKDKVLVDADVWHDRSMTSIRCRVMRVEVTLVTRVFVFPEDSKYAPKWVKASQLFVKLRKDVPVIY